MASCLIKMKYTRVIFGLCCSLALTFSKIGLTNPGNLCYLNSVIQSLYHVEDFRQRILALKSVEDLPVANAMKNLFWELTVKAKGMSMLPYRPEIEYNLLKILFNPYLSMRV